MNEKTVNTQKTAGRPQKQRQNTAIDDNYTPLTLKMHNKQQDIHTKNSKNSYAVQTAALEIVTIYSKQYSSKLNFKLKA